jgi:uncharacterized secreted protein with C-terminal beta-propeller domain
MNPGDRPRTGLLTVIGAVASITAVSALVIAVNSTPAAADELVTFRSCDDLQAWTADSVADGGTADGGMALDVAGPTATPEAGAATQATTQATGDKAARDATGAAGATGATNVAVAGVDELDIIDRLPDDRALVAAAGRLSIIDLHTNALVTQLDGSPDSQITYDGDASVAWVVGTDDEGRLTVTRVHVGPTTLDVDATWSTSGYLVDARRVDDLLYLVAADNGAVMPFENGPVPCDQVLHPVGQSDPAATLIVSLPAIGPLQPEHATEVVGSGELVHVTTDAAYLATPLWGDRVETSIHRFDLDTLALTGSGRVEGSLLSQYAMSDVGDRLRVAVTTDDGFNPRVMDDVMVPELMPEATDARAPSDVAAPDPGPALPRNEVLVLDTDGDLDIVGRTGRFGHPGESIEGIRFDGDVAYAVTYLQTDPFYVIDLADPQAPRVVGEVQLPGFSAYLHPVGDGLVAGFGPDDAGTISVKLFDVSRPSEPRVIDSLVLGDESPVAWDPHAFIDLGDGRFAVPASSYRTSLETSVVVIDSRARHLELVQRLTTTTATVGAERVLPAPGGWALLAGNHWIGLADDGRQTADIELGPAELAYATGGRAIE